MGFITRSRNGVRRTAFALGKTGMRFFAGVRLEVDEHAVAAFCDCFADRTDAACLTTVKLAFWGGFP